MQFVYMYIYIKRTGGGVVVVTGVGEESFFTYLEHERTKTGARRGPVRRWLVVAVGFVAE